MRSEKIFTAVNKVQNRYVLCQLTAQAARKFHRPNTRIQETVNEVLDRFTTSPKLEGAAARPLESARQAA